MKATITRRCMKKIEPMQIIIKVTMSTNKLHVEEVWLENFWDIGRIKKHLKCAICIGIITGDKFTGNNQNNDGG